MSSKVITQSLRPADDQTDNCIRVEGTAFPNQQALTKERVLINAKGLREVKSASSKKSASWLKLAEFGDKPTEKRCLRNDANVLAVTGAELDYDDGELAIDLAVARLKKAGIKAIVYTSASHTPSMPKWRVLLPFCEPFRGTKEEMKAFRKNAVLHAEKALGVKADRASYNLSQAFYYGPVKDTEEHYQVSETPGEYINVLYDLKATVPESLAPVSDDSLGQMAAGLETLKGRGDTVTWSREVMDGTNLHDNLIRLAGHLAQSGTSQRVCTGHLEALLALSAAGHDRVEQRHRELGRTIDSAYEKFAPGVAGYTGLPEDADGSLAIKATRMSDIVSRKQEWLWPGRLPKGQLVLLGGMPGAGKSTISSEIAACLTAGRVWPDGADYTTEMGVMWCVTEEDMRCTVKPRLVAGGGNPELIVLPETTESVKLSSNMAALEYSLTHAKELYGFEIGLVIMDPFMNYVGSQNSNSDGETREILDPLAQVLQRTGVTMLGICHLNKKANMVDPIHALMGTTAFAGIARSIHFALRISERRVFAICKSSGGAEDKYPAMYYQITNTTVPADEGDEIDTALLEWQEKSTEQFTQLWDAAMGRMHGSPKTEAAVIWLRAKLLSGPIKVTDLKADCSTESFSWDTVEKAGKRLGVVKTKGEFQGKSMWSLPKDSRVLEELSSIKKCAGE